MPQIALVVCTASVLFLVLILNHLHELPQPFLPIITVHVESSLQCPPLTCSTRKIYTSQAELSWNKTIMDHQLGEVRRSPLVR